MASVRHNMFRPECKYVNPKCKEKSFYIIYITLYMHALTLIDIRAPPTRQ